MRFREILFAIAPLSAIALTGVMMGMGGIMTAPARADVTIAQATSAMRVQQRQQQERQVRPENYDLTRFPLTDTNERHWRNILWTTAVVEPQADYVDQAVAQLVSFSTRPGLSDAQQRIVEMALQIGTQLYLSQPANHALLGSQFQQTVERSPDPEWVAMALSALVKAGADPQQQQQWSDRVRQRFPQWNQNVYLYTTLRDIDILTRPLPPPPLTDLLNWTIAPGQPQLYVICSPDRGALCQTVLKDRNGQFVRQSGQLWSVPLSLRSIHNLSWNFTRGETPQGIYRIEGTRSPDAETFRAYGSFPLVALFVPYEEGVREFLPGRPGSLTGSVTAYQALLPPSWRNYFPIQESYWAGKAGRGLFRIHGSGEAPSFFTNNSRYPNSANWNPTLGCLSALELYDDSGRLQQADMPRILSTLQAAGGGKLTGYLIVVEVPDPVSLESQIPQ